MFNSASAYTKIGQEKTKQFAKILIEKLTLDEIITTFIFVANKILSSSQTNVIQELNSEIRSTQASLAALLFKFIAYKYENNADVCKNFIKDELSKLDPNREEKADPVIYDCWKGYIDDTKNKLASTQLTFDNIKEDVLKNKLQLDNVDLSPLPEEQSITSPEDTITNQLQNLIDSFCTYLNQDDQSHWHFEMKDTDYFFQSDSGDIKTLCCKLKLILDEIKNAIKADNLQQEDSIREVMESTHENLASKDIEHTEKSITRYQQLEYYVSCIEPLLDPSLPDKFFSSKTQQILITKINEIKEILKLFDTKKTTIMENKDSETPDTPFPTPGQLKTLWAGF